MFNASPTDPAVKALLLWLSDLDRRRGGYELLGVRGWAQVRDIPDRLVRHTDGLPRIAERRLVDRVNIALPGRATPFWLYRINARGAELAAVVAPAPAGDQDESPSPRMIFTDEQWTALRFMRRAKTQASPTRFVTKELGWRTIKEIREGAAIRSEDLQIWPEDVAMLERAGLLQKRDAAGVDRLRPIIFYQITDIGERVTRLERHAPVGSAGRE